MGRWCCEGGIGGGVYKWCTDYKILFKNKTDKYAQARKPASERAHLFEIEFHCVNLSSDKQTNKQNPVEWRGRNKVYNIYFLSRYSFGSHLVFATGLIQFSYNACLFVLIYSSSKYLTQ